MDGLLTWKCVDCDEDYKIILPKANKCHVCSVCGLTLVKVESVSATLPSTPGGPQFLGLNGSWEGLFDILGDDFRAAVEESIAMTAPTRQISTKYLSTLGKAVVDARHSILYDISVVVGPLTILGVSSSFGYLPDGNNTHEQVLNLVVADTHLKEGTVVPSSSALALTRGEISFEQKCVQAISAGSSALLVFQTYDKWPFIMTEDSGRSFISPIPVIMISKLHGELITKIVSSQSRIDSRPVEVKIKIGERVTECSVCQEDFSEGDEVLKLPCRHVYHCHCVTTWLQQNHTCPLCRLQLPRELPSSSSVNPISGGVNDNFYG